MSWFHIHWWHDVSEVTACDVVKGISERWLVCQMCRCGGRRAWGTITASDGILPQFVQTWVDHGGRVPPDLDWELDGRSS